MEDNKTETTVVPPATDEGKTSEPSQNNRPERSEADKAAYNLKKNAERVKELGLDPKKVLGVESDDEVPAWYKAEKAKEAKETAMQMAERVADEDTKEKVKDYLSNRIVPSGNPEEDFKLAMAAASAAKNKQIVEEVSRYTTPRVVSVGGSQPAKVEDEFIPTEAEARMMKPPYNVPKEKIILARKAEAAKKS